MTMKPTTSRGTENWDRLFHIRKCKAINQKCPSKWPSLANLAPEDPIHSNKYVSLTILMDFQTSNPASKCLISKLFIIERKIQHNHIPQNRGVK